MFSYSFLCLQHPSLKCPNCIPKQHTQYCTSQSHFSTSLDYKKNRLPTVPFHDCNPGVGNFFSRRAICGKTKSFPGRIIRWIKFNICYNYYCQSCSDWKAKKRFTHPVLFFYEKEQEKGLHVFRCPVLYQKYR